MSNKTAYLAFDYGASSGRLMLVTYDGDKLELEQIHRFPNEPVWMNGHFYWDFPRLFHEMKQGLKKAARLGIEIAGIGIDTWGVDYGYVDADGCLISNPFCYRDPKNAQAMAEMDEKWDFAECYKIAGIQKIDFNTMYQLYYDVKHRKYVVDAAESVLFMPDLFAYYLTGKKVCEYSIASTGQLLDAKSRELSDKILEEIGIDKKMFGTMVQPGTIIGELTDEIMEETGMKKVPVIAVGSHDTASAVCGTPLAGEDSIFLSSGTWALIGMELPEPIISEESYEYNFTNEGGVEGTIRFLKNITGLWILQQLKKKWNETEPELGFPEIIAAARAAERKHFTIDPDQDVFTAPMNMVKAVQDYCEANGQGRPETMGEIAMAAYNGLAQKIKVHAESLEKLTGKTATDIHMVGGGIQDQFLCETLAHESGKVLTTGPIEAAICGSVLMQMKALGQLNSLQEGRDLIKRSFPIKQYQP
ncbi:MAG: rhamnulokinase [Firmicutes bacterium]|nr:rhamnulokinase [Bacillota bacterium]